MYTICALWGVGGTIWLLSHRRYRLSQIGLFFMGLLGFPVEASAEDLGAGQRTLRILFTQHGALWHFHFPANAIEFLGVFYWWR